MKNVSRQKCTGGNDMRNFKLGFLMLFILVGQCFSAQGVYPVSYTSGNKTSQWTVYTEDERYAGKVSTHTAGKLIVTGNIPAINFNVTKISYYSAGGLTTITGIGGTTYIPSGSSLSQSFEIGFSTPTITATLAASTTLYYDITGTR